MTITRVPLREQVHHAIIGRILREELAPGSRISDSAMAGELGVSRTPVREALLRLEREGFLEVDVGRGFFVKPLSAAEVREAYPILWTLEVLALRTSPPLSRARLAELARINAELADTAGDPERRIDLDVEWHRTLLGECGNARLLEMLNEINAVIRRYRYAYMQNAGNIPVSTSTHERIARAVEAGDVEAAVPLLESNWRWAMERIMGWIERGADRDPATSF
jgi:DNA-binding GntR family transcriptional regulator